MGDTKYMVMSIRTYLDAKKRGRLETSWFRERQLVIDNRVAYGEIYGTDIDPRTEETDERPPEMGSPPNDDPD